MSSGYFDLIKFHMCKSISLIGKRPEFLYMLPRYTNNICSSILSLVLVVMEQTPVDSIIGFYLD